MKDLLIVVAVFFVLFIFAKNCDTASDKKTKENVVYSTMTTQQNGNIESQTSNPKHNNSSILTTRNENSNPYLNNRLHTGSMPYGYVNLPDCESKISVSTSSSSECDVVVIVKHKGRMVRNAYIVAGGSYTFDVPNGSYQVFFYGGKGWNPNKSMAGGYRGGFVTNESFSKDSEIYLDYESVEYELIPQPNGNFSTQKSDEIEVF